MVESQRSVNGQEASHERRYYISSLGADAKELNRVIRSHWSIENSLHWVLDIAFREDDSRIRKDHGPENMATLRHIALNLLKQDKSIKVGIKSKRKNAGWSEAYLLKVLNG
jgi:predicted transposase YbfD/YdcC